MTGLDLEGFLHLLRADLGAWATLGVIALVLGLMAWTSWGSRRALRKCLVLSVLAYCGLALYGGTIPVVLLALKPDDPANAAPERIRKIQVISRPSDEGTGPSSADPHTASASALAPWDSALSGPALADAKLEVSKPERSHEELRVQPAVRP